jgi:hypothetical protein
MYQPRVHPAVHLLVQHIEGQRTLTERRRGVRVTLRARRVLDGLSVAYGGLEEPDGANCVLGR